MNNDYPVTRGICANPKCGVYAPLRGPKGQKPSWCAHCCQGFAKQRTAEDTANGERWCGRCTKLHEIDATCPKIAPPMKSGLPIWERRARDELTAIRAMMPKLYVPPRRPTTEVTKKKVVVTVRFDAPGSTDASAADPDAKETDPFYDEMASILSAQATSVSCAEKVLGGYGGSWE